MFLEIDGATSSPTQIRDEDNVECNTRQVQFNRVAPVDQPRFINMKTAARTKYAALTFGPAVATTHGVSSKFAKSAMRERTMARD